MNKDDTKDAENGWAGALELPGRRIDIVVRFGREPDGGVSAELAVPAQGVAGLKLASVRFEAERLEFTLEKPSLPKETWEHYSLTRERFAPEARGQVQIGAASFPVTLRRLAAGEEPAASADAEPAQAERWGGTIIAGAKIIEIVVAFQRAEGGAARAWLSVPAGGLRGLKLAKPSLGPERLEFTLEKPGLPEAAWEHYVLTRKPDAAEASGFLEVGGQQLPVKLTRLEAGQAPPTLQRPQTPKPPFPYAAREVEYENPTDHSRIGGTLTLPQGKGPFAAVLMITGSGSQDRDETIFGHKPFLVLADALTRKGLAVLRVDDRGVGKSTGDIRNATIQLHATDVQAGIVFLKSQPEIDPHRIGLMGHSEGGIIAPLVASESAEVAFIVSLAGTGLPGSEISPMQMEILLKAQGASPDAVRELVAQQNKLMAVLVKDGDDQAVRAEVRRSLDLAIKHGLAPELKGWSEQQLDAKAAAEAVSATVPWTRSFAKTDPRKLWPKVRCPVLMLVGENDTQVPADVNLDAVGKALKAGGNHDATLRKLPKLNHLFQHAKTGQLDEYATIEETFDPATLELIGAWLTERTQPKP